MKSFKQFLKTVAPIIVDVLPVHGSHSSKKKPPVIVDTLPVHGSHSKKKLKESFEHGVDERPEPGVHGSTFHEHQGISDKKWKGIDSSYKPHPDDEHTKPSKSVYEYSKHSLINHHLINHAVGKPSFFHSTHSEYLDAAKKHGYKFPSTEITHKNQNRELNTQKRHLDHAISSNKLKHATTVYHGTSFNPHEFASKHPNRHIKLPSYTSTSTSSEMASDFASPHHNPENVTKDHSHVLRIHLPKGHQALPILHRSHHEHEHEVLLHRNSTFKISEKPTHSVDLGHKIVHYWDAHPVGHKNEA